ncbi:MAG: sigma 54-interacting transcriptional regulator, partial [bacterium]
SFTGAHKSHIGRVEKANGGTLFLDEAGNLNLSAQAKLLRMIQDREFERVGGEKSLKADVRLIAATNADLNNMVLKGKFRKDLFFRLNVIEIHLPPLKDRKDDIPHLVRYFLERTEYKKPWKIENSALQLMEKHDWPGNIRELFNVLEYCITTAKNDTITPDNLPLRIINNKNNNFQVSETILHNRDTESFDLAIKLTGGGMEPLEAFLGISGQALIDLISQTSHSTSELNRPCKQCRLLNNRQFKILGLIHRRSPVTIRELIPIFNLTKITLNRDMNKLIKTGLIKRLGSGRAVRFEWVGNLVPG